MYLEGKGGDLEFLRASAKKEPLRPPQGEKGRKKKGKGLLNLLEGRKNRESIYSTSNGVEKGPYNEGKKGKKTELPMTKY